MTRLARLFAKLRTPAMVGLCALGIIGIVIALDAIHQIGVAHADTGQVVAAAPVAPVPVVAPVAPAGGESIMAIIALIVGIVSAVGMGISNALHIIAPRTKTTWDDRGLAKLDEMLGLLRLIPVPTKPTQADLDALKLEADRHFATVSGTAPAESFDTKTAITAKLPQSGRIHIGAALVLAFAAILALPLLGCNTLSSAPGAAKDAVIDCTKADEAAIAALVSELGADAVTTALGTGSADWAKLEADAVGQGKVVGGCALAEFVAALSKAKPPAVASARLAMVPPPTPADQGRASLERFRAQMGGARWSTEVP